MALKKLSLSKLEASTLNEAEMNDIAGGWKTVTIIFTGITCGCIYKNRGGASTSANRKANIAQGKQTLRDNVYTMQTLIAGDEHEYVVY
nr:TIGR04149 family rSAM-modified RiPP [uncultured Prevotella sp.]